MRRWLAPEVIQTSAMDCGPAALKCLLDGHGREVSYGRLREACQTDVDGTSIDTLEDLAVAMGLEAEQVIVPADHVVEPTAALLPAIIVVRQPSGLTHFVVAWRTTLGVVQVMDPATGRRWPARGRFLDEVYRHGMTVPAADWRGYAGGEDFLPALRAQLTGLGAPAGALIAAALADPTWRGLAALDAAARLARSLRASGALTAGEAARLVETLAATPDDIPEGFWSARASAKDPDGLEVTGAVLVRVQGVRAAGGPPPPASLAEALRDPPPRPLARLALALRADGVLPLALLALATPLAAALVLGGDVLLRSFFDLGRSLQIAGQRFGAMLALVLFAGAVLLLESGAMAAALRAGRRLEARLRLAILDKLPRTADRYFRSRLVSDLATRAHALTVLRGLPPFGLRGLSAMLGLALAAAGVIWLVPAAWPLAVLAAAVAVAVPAAAQPVLVERDLRARSIAATLARALLDGLLGLPAVRAHRAERTVRRGHEALLVDQARAALAHLRVLVATEAVQGLAGAALAVALVWGHADRLSESGAVLLFVYWTLGVPLLGGDLAAVARQIPAARNVTLRLLEPLDAPEEELPAAARPPGPPGGAAIDLRDVTLLAGGHALVRDVTLAIAPGSHVAVVGRSGAGKSSLAGALLGLHRPAAGALTVDGAPLDEAHLETLRRSTVWVDPAVHLWNRSFYDNLAYGNDAPPEAATLVAAAELATLLERLPDGLQTPLGEGGALVSGGEGQRVRFGRALARGAVRLAILDEPFRGLDREARRRLTARAREAFAGATMIYISHDVGETLAFERVLVIEDGKVIEDGPPASLAGLPSRYRALLDAEAEIRRGAWARWRKLRLEGGKIV